MEEVVMRKKHKDESFESLIRRFRKNVEKKDTLNEVKRREHFVKPSTKRKVAKDIAKKREKKRQRDLQLKRF